MSFIHWRRWRTKLLHLAVLISFFQLSPEARGQGAAISVDTKSGFTKSNQSKVFYHGGTWWAIAFNNPDSRWYIWKFSGGAWANANSLSKSSSIKYDAVVNSTTGTLYVMGSHGSTSEFRRYTYSSGPGAWVQDAGFSVNPSFINADGNNPVSLVQAKNGDLWIFRIETNKLQAKKSTDGGATWSAVIDIKTGLTVASGTTDAVAFTSSGNNFVGVVYGEADAAGTKYGFLRHQDGAADATWTDETSALTFFGAERGNNQLSMTTDGSNNIFVLTKNGNAAGSDPRNTLYKRSSAGTWTKFKVNTSTDWKSPALAYDATNNRLFVMGINNSSQQGEYKTCAAGQEATLEAATASLLFAGAGATFTDLSAPPSGSSVDIASGLLMGADNNAASDIWYNQIAISSTAPVTIGAVTLTSYQANANAGYTIPLTLSAIGALPAGSGIINLTFPNNTFVPGSITASNISVNGTPCTNVTSDAATRQLIITTPVNLSNNQTFSVVITAATGLLNPTLVGAYQLHASTSAQPAQATSASYNITAATTTVTPATVTTLASEPDSCTNYTLAFNLGAQGRLLGGTSTITVTFNAATQVANGALTGAMVNGVAATAAGNSATKVVNVTVPAALVLSNSAAITLSLPASAICNPSTIGDYTLTVATSVETTPINSNPYKIIGRVVLDAIMVSPANASTNAAYTIPLTLSVNGALTAGSGVIGFRFPIGTIVPSGITPNSIAVNGTPATNATSNNVTREVLVTTPVNLANSQNFSVVFNLSAGIINPPNAGDYTLQAWTSAQPTPVTSAIYSLAPSLGANPISTTTQSGYKKSNQSKVFYYNTQWWAVAFEEPENKWYIWKFNGSIWTKAVGMDKGLARYYDVVVNPSANKLYLFSMHKSSSKFRRYSYVGGTWKNDSGFAVSLTDFVSSDFNNPVSLVQAKNGDLWLFRIKAGVLEGKRSSDGGLTWSAIVPIKSGLNASVGTTDAAAFTSGGKNYVGVGYGEKDTLASKFGFLKHEDGAADNAWTDESASLTAFVAERGLNQISMTVDAGNNVYLFTQNAGVTAGAPKNTLYKRSSAGAWTKFKVNIGATVWRAPALAINATANTLYLMGVNTTTLLGEMKSCDLGQEATLEAMSASELFNVPGGQFNDLSAPAANVTGASGLMVCADNLAVSDIYYRYLDLGGSTPLIVNAVTPVSNQINANATYTVSLTLSNTGSLSAGNDVLNFVFPPNTAVSNTMPPAAVKVDGVPATTVIANGVTRQVAVTTPVNLANNQTFTVVFDSAAGAGLINPTTVASNYRITCWTSTQPVQVKSPMYSLVQTTTTVTAPAVAVFPTDPDSLADYTLNFSLGGHGRLIPGASTIVVKFNAATKVSNGVVPGAQVNAKAATATADSILRQVAVTVPASLTFPNNAAITLVLPKSKVRNPNIAGLQTLLVATSVETTFVASQPFELKASASIGGPIIGTTKAFDRNNQSKVFYHGGFWWVAAQAKADLKWYLWKFNGLTWTQSSLIYTAGKSRPDCALDGAANKVYILLPGASNTYITRMSFASGAGNWTTDAGYPVVVPDFSQVSDKGVNLTRAKNGHFWVFRATDSTLTAKRSSDLGLTWSPTIVVKKHLHNRDALTDATAFTPAGGSYIGVGYAENSAPGSVYGFLRHKDTDADTVWTDDTAFIPQFTGTTSDDHISMITYQGEILMLVKTNGGGPSVTNIGLLRRNLNGVWTQYPILKSTGWTRPVMAIDQTNERLYVMGSREGGIKVGEMKHCAIGDYAALYTAPIDTIFKNESDSFFNPSVPLHTVTSATNLLVCNSNETREELWYKVITISGTPKTAAETPAVTGEFASADFEGVQVYPNPFNPQTSFRFKLKDQAAVKLQIFNLNGQLVRTLADEDLTPGVYQRRWNGRDQKGRPAASGLYFYRLQIGPKIFNGRIQMIK